MKKQHRSIEGTVTVLTPEPLVRCLRQGYRPEIHESVLARNMGSSSIRAADGQKMA